MSSEFAIGWEHASWAAGYLLGVLAYVACLALAYVVVNAVAKRAFQLIAHRVRVRRIRRQARRAGRNAR